MRQRVGGGEGFGHFERRFAPVGRVATLLADAIYEGTERAIDEAVQVLLDGLKHPDMSKRLVAAAYLLRHTEAGRRRGWGRGSELSEDAVEPKNITLKWLDDP